MLKLGRFRPPVRRVLALDAGGRRIKVLLAQSDFGRVRVVKEELIDLQAEGLVSPKEVKAHLEVRLQEWGNPALALVLPQHLAISHVVDLPQAPESEVDKLIAEETIKLSGLSESRIIYDFVRTEGAARNRQQFWVTQCPEGNIRDWIAKLGVEHDDICEVTTTANALIAAYRAAAPAATRSILVHLGAQTTVVVVVVAGHGAFATSFPMGGDFFTRALMRLRRLTEEKAESLKRGTNCLEGPEAVPDFATVVDGWAEELRRQLGEWFQSRPGQDPAEFEYIATGGGFDQPGLLDYLREHGKLALKPWPRGGAGNALTVSSGFEVALGTVLQALGHSALPISLLPDNYRAGWQKRLVRQRIEVASIVLAAICAVLLGFATWHKANLIRIKQALLQQVEAGQETVDTDQALTAELLSEYENLRPVLAGQQNTIDTLRTLDLLQQSRTNRNYWFVLVADQQSYFSQPPASQVPPPAPPATNSPASTNAAAAAPAPELALVGSLLRPWPLGLTNSAPVKPGLIAEVCVPGEAEASRQVIRGLVDDLKKGPLFAKVDSLSDDLRRTMADPKVIVPERDFVLVLDFAVPDFQASARLRKNGAAVPVRTPPRRTARPAGAEESPVP